MSEPHKLSNSIHKPFMLGLVAFGVFANGALLLLGILGRLQLFRRLPTSDARVSVTIVIGMSLLYLSTLLVRRKQAAWLITLIVYGFLLGSNISEMAAAHPIGSFGLAHFLRSIVLPLVIVGSLTYYRHEFTVKSDIRNFTLSLRFVAIALLTTFVYGVLGFLLLDKRDFHLEISLAQAAHYTVDQFNITTTHPLVAHTDRGRLFLYSLSLVSIMSLVYAAVALFQPIRARFSDQTHNRERLWELLSELHGSSEDFFKIWPHDKEYFMTPSNQAGLAFRVERGVALVVGDPVGKKTATAQLMNSFHELCRTNDWLPAFVHTEPKWSSFYKSHDYTLQKIGQEAIVPLETFVHTTAHAKYFRNIDTKFKRQGYTSELLTPPHNDAILDRLQHISDEWLTLPGRTERGFMLGYFTRQYMQQCTVMVIRDAAGTIQAFINQIPSFDPAEANYDLLRQTKSALGNINDYLLIEFSRYLLSAGFSRLNLGLCPLVGLNNRTDDKTIVDNALQFVYSNGDRFYSFSGLYRFKAKYEPAWQNRYIAYRGGLRGFTRTVNALNRAMSRVRSEKKA